MSGTVPPSRVVRSRRDAQANYDRLARWYTWLASSEEPFRRKAIELLDARPGEWVLEIGCGSGTSLSALSDRGVRPVGIDLSYGMLRVTQEQARSNAARSNAARSNAAGSAAARKNAVVEPLLCQGDGLHLPYPTGCFDALLLTFTLELFDTPEIPHVLAECRRVLKHGGRASIASLAAAAQPGAPAGAPARIYAWFHERFPALVDCRPIPLQEMVEQAGFAIQEKSTGVMWGLPVACVLAQN
jgi:ubiquinone/menaquinone biosynthesis C-methylase UbiE